MAGSDPAGSCLFGENHHKHVLTTGRAKPSHCITLMGLRFWGPGWQLIQNREFLQRATAPAAWEILKKNNKKKKQT